MVESAHYLQVILAFYNVNAGIRRCDEPDFGHPCLTWKIEFRVELQTFGELLFFQTESTLVNTSH